MGLSWITSDTHGDTGREMHTAPVFNAPVEVVTIAILYQ